MTTFHMRIGPLFTGPMNFLRIAQLMVVSIFPCAPCIMNKVPPAFTGGAVYATFSGGRYTPVVCLRALLQPADGLLLLKGEMDDIMGQHMRHCDIGPKGLAAVSLISLRRAPNDRLASPFSPSAASGETFGYLMRRSV